SGRQKGATVVSAARHKLSAARNEPASDDTPGDSQPKPTKLGVTVKAVSPEMAERMGTPEGKGVQVVDVRPDSFAYDIGLTPGLIILKVNNQPVNTHDESRKLTS